MPCGGIWTPAPGSHWLAHPCWVCHELGCELFCDEWDTTLHMRCLGKFLQTEEGRCMLAHGHGISIPEREDGASWPGVELASSAPPNFGMPVIDLRQAGDITFTCPTCQEVRAVLRPEGARMFIEQAGGTVRCAKCGAGLQQEIR